MGNSTVMDVHLNEFKVAPAHVNETHLQISIYILLFQTNLSPNISILISVVKLCPKIHSE